MKTFMLNQISIQREVTWRFTNQPFLEGGDMALTPKSLPPMIELQADQNQNNAYLAVFIHLKFIKRELRSMI